MSLGPRLRPVNESTGRYTLVEKRQLQGTAFGGELLDRGALSAVIQSIAAGLRSSLMRASVIIPRSPTITTRVSPKRS
jgi:hypothetical protein